MQPNLEVRRHNDGSIEFDFYRRRAWRRRRLARRMIFKRCQTAIGQAARASLAAVVSPIARLSLRRRELRPVLRPAMTARMDRHEGR